MFFSCKLISVVYCFFWFLHMVSFFHAYLVVFDNDMLILLGILFVGFFFFKALNKVWSVREDLHLILLGTFKKIIIVFYISVGLLLRYCFLIPFPTENN